MEVHQLLPSASRGDAITNASLDLQDQLGQYGRSQIFARHVDPALAGRIHPLDHYAERHTADLLVYHVSIGEPTTFSFVRRRPERLVIVYHNISPSHYWDPYDTEFASLLDTGRKELAQLAARADLAIAASEFNADELRALGFPKVVVNNLAVDVEALQGVTPDAAMVSHLARLDGPKILFVGQMLPHKRPDWLLSAYHVLATYLQPQAHLLLVGAHRLQPYRQALSSFVADLGLTRAHLTGSVSLESLVACFRAADVFVTASEHEGFCVPLLEAMAFDVPVLARAYGAIPDTLGNAGLLLQQEDGPSVAAEAMDLLLRDDDLRAMLVSRGRRRVGEFCPDNLSATLVTHLLSVIS